MRQKKGDGLKGKNLRGGLEARTSTVPPGGKVQKGSKRIVAKKTLSKEKGDRPNELSADGGAMTGNSRRTIPKTVCQPSTVNERGLGGLRTGGRGGEG